MKNFYVLILLVVVFNIKVSATIYTSAQNGNWLNPLTWSPIGIPVPGDVAIINHNVVLDTSFAYASGSVTINASGSLVQDSPVRDIWLNGTAASFTNNGSVTIRSMLLSAGNFTNSNDFNVKTVANYITLDNTVSGVVNGVDSLFNDGTFNNNGVINIVAFYNDSTINNYGAIQGLTTVVDSMYNKGYIFNDSLAIIYADSFTNDGNVWNEGRLILNQLTSLSGTVSNEKYIQVNDFTNMGRVQNSDSLIVLGDITNVGRFFSYSNAYLQFNNLSHTDPLNNLFQNMGTIKGYGSITNSSFFVNVNYANLEIDGSFLNYDITFNDAILYNGGTFKVGGSFYNYDSINGNYLGRFEVQDTSYNHSSGKMTGDFDFCDLTPPVTPIKIDFNLGSVDPSITYCSTVGLIEEESFTAINLYPNPTTGRVYVGNENQFIEVYTVEGKKIINDYTNQIDLSSYQSGIYFLIIKDKNGNLVFKEKLIKE